MFFIMVMLWSRAFLKKEKNASDPKKIIALTGIISLLYGVMMEFVQQYLVSNRSFDIGDIIADGIGCTLAVIYSLRTVITKN